MTEHSKLNSDQVKSIIHGESVVMDVHCPGYDDKVHVVLSTDKIDIYKNPRDEAKKIRFVGGYEICPECAAKLGYEYHGRKVCYCLECGQKIVRGV